MIWNPWKEIKRLRADIERIHETWRERNEKTLHLLHSSDDARLELRNALQHIAAEEKPTSNATVKRMAKIARGALEI